MHDGGGEVERGRGREEREGETRLPRRVPDLQFDSLAVQLHAPDLKVDPAASGARRGDG